MFRNLMIAATMGIAFVTSACGDDDDDKECDDLAGQIRVVAERDPDLKNYQGMDRSQNPCADPVPVTSSTNYQPACAKLKACLDD